MKLRIYLKDHIDIDIPDDWMDGEELRELYLQPDGNINTKELIEDHDAIFEDFIHEAGGIKEMAKNAQVVCADRE